ncbi:MAG TPA: 6-phosphofructokinase [Anaerolineae bacterium]|nr:6-phosphofructokinase [Anaerolineae bacterium]
MAVRCIGVLTSGGDAPGMNAAVRAVVRCALDRGLTVFGIHEGWQGAVDGSDKIQPLSWRSVGGILQRGGTILRTARSADFRTWEGRKRAACNLYERGIDALVVIGGDGSLTGAQVLADEWPGLIAELAAEGAISLEEGEEIRSLQIIGLPGSIDNDLYGTDMSIGADTALHTITRNVDQLESTAASHQRTFIVEVMGRNCGYLALSSTLATGGHWVLIPEEEMELRWHQKMVQSIKRGREAGRRHDLIIFAEGARHTDGLPIRAEVIRDVLERQLGLEPRITVLGHVQRGGSPSAFDRILATRLGAAAVDELINAEPDTPPRMMGLVNNQVVATPLSEVVEKSRAVNIALDNADYQTAMQSRGHSFQDQLALLKVLTRAWPQQETNGTERIAIVTADADAPGMNAAVRTAVRTALNEGFGVLGARYGLSGLVKGDLIELGWMSVHGWTSRGGSELGAGRYRFQEDDFERLAGVIQWHHISGLIVIGGWTAYQNVQRIVHEQRRRAGLNVPIICIPATIDNNLPATDFSIGADTALNNIVEAVDKIKYTAGATHRAFVIEVMGGRCGFLALMSALATGAERAYLPEEGISLADLNEDVRALITGFQRGKQLAILILNERASAHYNTDLIRRVMEEEGKDEFEVRAAILGHLQRGGVPSPFDRILASRLGAHAVSHLLEDIRAGATTADVIGLRGKRIEITRLAEALKEMDAQVGRPRHQWYLNLLEVARILAQPDVSVE